MRRCGALCIIRCDMRLTAADVNQLADRVRTEYLVRKRDTDPVAEALDVLERILIWAETPLAPSTDLAEVGAVEAINHQRQHVRLIAGQDR